MGKIRREEVTHVANLARLDLNDDEQELMLKDLNAILGYVDQLDELDVSGVEAMTHPHPQQMLLRDDEPHQSLSIEQAMRNAPNANEREFIVPKVV